MWAGGIVGLISIFGIKNRAKALKILDILSKPGLLEYEPNEKTKKLSYRISDWVIECSEEECMDGNVYTTDGYGFLCVPRSITERLVKQNYTFGEADAWMNLWCHTVS